VVSKVIVVGMKSKTIFSVILRWVFRK